MRTAFQATSFNGCCPVPESVSSTAMWERRQSARHACDGASTRASVFLGSEPCLATLRDISAGGIAVVVDAIVAPGDRLNVALHNSATGAWSCKVLQVVHATRAQGGRWLVGGAFSQALSAEELRPLLPRWRGRVA
jgi:PilZ domain